MSTLPPPQPDDSYERLTTECLGLRRRLLTLIDLEERTSVSWYIGRRAVVHLYDAFNALLELEHEARRANEKK